MSKSKMLLILERSNAKLTVDKESGDYVLEGIFAQFGVENNNKRIYEEKEYLPHLDYLKKKISENRLMGELDHPEKFEVSLDKVSHIIENLEYDSNSRQIKGRVRVLDTPAGKIARSLIDSGVPISISSRAAGTVSESKKVNIKRIFTYDLVADPGFEDAQLARVNESFGLEADDDIQIFDASAWDSSYSAFESNDSETKDNTEIKETEKVDSKYVTVDAMNKYSEVIKEEIIKLNKKLEDVSENTSDDTKKDLKEQIETLAEYATSLSEEINTNRGYAEHLSGEINENRGYSEHLMETINEGAESFDKIDKVVDYLNEEIAPNVDKLIDHNNHLVEKLNTSIGYVEDEIVSKLDESLQHSDYLAEEIEKNRAYTEFLSENAVSNEDFKDLVEYSEMMFETYSGGSSKKGKSADISEDENTEATKKKAIRESSSKPGDITKRGLDITNSVDTILEQIKKEKIDSLTESKRYPFTTLISDEQRAEFTALDETKKEKVREALLETKSFDKTVLRAAFTDSLLEKEVVDSTPKWLAEAPTKFKAIYESLDEAGKSKIQAQSNWYQGKLENTYQIKNFWETRGLNETVKPEVNDVLNENLTKETKQVKSAGTMHAHNLGYNSSKVDAIKESLNRFKGQSLNK
jgi:hypothetical protein